MMFVGGRARSERDSNVRFLISIEHAKIICILISFLLFILKAIKSTCSIYRSNNGLNNKRIFLRTEMSGSLDDRVPAKYKTNFNG
jgi:hypothetical protein